MTDRARFKLLTAIGWLILGAAAGRADDWPVYQQNNQRNAKSAERLSTEALRLAWQLQLPGPPNPAWSGPAKWDAYAGIRGLKSMRDYDPVYHMIVAGQRVWCGSSTDDTVHCLDLQDGSTRWTFTTDGPVRVAPAYSAGRVYFGSDDGYAYCVDSDSGELNWRFSPQPTDRRILCDGRFISQWPVRTGVTLEAGRAYFGASLLPWIQSYLCAVDASTGAATGDGLFVQRVDDATMEGPLSLLPGRYLVSPQGRVPPRLFTIADGKSLGSLKGGGGSFVVLTKDSVLHGPGNKTGWLTASSLDTLETVASFKNGNAMLVAGDISFILTDDTLAAANYVSRAELWSVDCDCPLSVILAGDTLFVGGQDRVRAFDAATGRERWSHAVDGKAFSLAAANGHLLVATDTARLYAFSAKGTLEYAPLSPLATDDVATNEATAQDTSAALRAPLPDDDPALLGRWVFQRPFVQGTKVANLAGGAEPQVTSRPRLVRLGDIQALRCTGSSSAWKIADVGDAQSLPQEAITAAAWVRVDEAPDWSGIVGCLQDNGDYERGWFLGCREQKFSFALAGNAENQDGLTIVSSPQEFALGSWHHVAGTYDGQAMRLYVDGQQVAESAAERGPIRYPERGSLVLGAYQDDNESYPLIGQLHEARIYRRALSATEVAAQQGSMAAWFPVSATPNSAADEGHRLALGPVLRFQRPGTASFSYQTAISEPTTLTLFLDDQPVRQVTTASGQDHRVEIDGLRHNRVYTYQIAFTHEGQTVQTAEYECDTHFDYAIPHPPGPHPQGAADPVAAGAAAAAVLDVSERAAQQALCLVIGCEDGQLIRDLIRHSAWRVVAFDDDAERVARLRHMLQSAGMYGRRATVHHVAKLSELPITSRVANVISTERPPSDWESLSAREVQRLLAPRGTAVMGGAGPEAAALPAAWLAAGRQPKSLANWVTLMGSEIAGAGDWSHIYGTGANNHYGGEALSQVRTADELAVQWLGRPGARYHADRNGRKPPPLSTAGRIFLQGLHRLIALDQYNGTILWAVEIPELDRYNMPRDSGNWCADDKFVYVAVHGQCWQLSAADGQLIEVLDVEPPSDSGATYDWGFIARDGELLFGSAVRDGTVWDDFWGNEGWYDAAEGPLTDKVCSDTFFARDLDTGQVRWRYSRGAIVNSTITIGDGTVYLVESRGEHLRDGKRRLGDEAFWQNQFLVALDAQTGRLCWEQPLQVQPGTAAFYMSYGDGHVVLVSSAQRNFHIYAFQGKTGKAEWQNQLVWGKGKADHGSHLSRPAIVGQQLFVRPGVFDLATGKQSPLTIPVGGCGSYACTDNAIFFRAGSGKNSAMWDMREGKYTMWNRLRPDCWLSTIPAGGMLLSPEGGGGCSCGTWLETSIGFLPRVALSTTAERTLRD